MAPDPGSPFVLDEVKADGQAGSLAERVAKKLGSAGSYSVQHAARSIRLSLETKVPTAWESGHVSVGALWGLYAQYPYMPRLRGRDALADALDDQPLLWQSEGFALAESYDKKSGRYVGLWLPGEAGRSPITDATLIVKPELAEAQRAAEASAGRGSEGGPPGSDPPGPPAGPLPPSAPPAKPVITRYIGSVPINAERYSGDFAKIAGEVLANLAASGAKLTISLSVDAISVDGFTEQQIRTIRENAATLKFTTNEFEVE